jgi:IS30 family transposase
MLVKLKKKDLATSVATLPQQIGKLPQELRRSLRWYQGTEIARYKSLTVATDLQVYFYDPRSPWQRGINKNTNGILKQYLRSSTNLPHLSHAQLNAIAMRLNQRPRKTLDFKTPADRLQVLR